MNGEFHNINEIIGEIITKEKYRFVEKQIINSVIRDVFEILLQEKDTQYFWKAECPECGNICNVRIQYPGQGAACPECGRVFQATKEEIDGTNN